MTDNLLPLIVIGMPFEGSHPFTREIAAASPDIAIRIVMKYLPLEWFGVIEVYTEPMYLNWKLPARIHSVYY
jgi:hypothetical protein